MPEPLDRIILKAIEGDLTEGDIQGFAQSQGISVAEAFDTASLTIAKRFDDAEMSYDNADSAINSIWKLMVFKATANGNGADEWKWPKLSFAIYVAFDEGEYDHRDGKNPIESFTKPTIKEILASKSPPHAPVLPPHEISPHPA